MTQISWLVKAPLLILFILASVAFLSLRTPVLAVGQPKTQTAQCQPASASGSVGDGCPCKLDKPFFFFLPPWWEYLNGAGDASGNCEPSFNFPESLWVVGLAVLDMLMRVAGLIAVVSIIIAGVESIFSGGNAEKAVSARRRIWNSLIGLGIVVVASAVVAFIGKNFT